MPAGSISGTPVTVNTCEIPYMLIRLPLDRAPSAIQSPFDLFDKPVIGPNSPVTPSAKDPSLVPFNPVPVQTAVSKDEGYVRNPLIGANSDPLHSPEASSLLDTLVPEARYTGTPKAPMFVMADTEDVDPIADHVSTVPPYTTWFPPPPAHSPGPHGRPGARERR